jgi:hypothetical protein
VKTVGSLTLYKSKEKAMGANLGDIIDDSVSTVMGVKPSSPDSTSAAPSSSSPSPSISDAAVGGAYTLMGVEPAQESKPPEGSSTGIWEGIGQAIYKVFGK